jgi:hypothetical protein
MLFDFLKRRVDKADGQTVENIPVSHILPTTLPTRYDLIESIIFIVLACVFRVSSVTSIMSQRFVPKVTFLYESTRIIKRFQRNDASVRSSSAPPV